MGLSDQPGVRNDLNLQPVMPPREHAVAGMAGDDHFPGYRALNRMRQATLHSPRYAARTRGSSSSILASPLIVTSPESIT